MKTVILGMLSAATLMFVHPASAQTTLIEVTGMFGDTSVAPSPSTSKHWKTARGCFP
ncbi:MAG: hypothetical protein AAGD11_19270 [Planctomycetota bacterium]